MLSRIADSLFWLNRYMERSRGILRVTRTHYNVSLDKDINGGLTWKPILEIFAQLPKDEILGIEQHTGKVLQKLLTDASNVNSIKSIVNRARENARGVQDHISKELWEEVNSMYHLTNQTHLTQRLSGPDAMDVVDLFTRHSVLYAGVADITMQRGPGWDFMKLGKYLERSLEAIVITEKQCQLFDYNLEDERDITQWRFLLMSFAGYEVYLKTYRSFKHNSNVMHQMLLNEDFPHSVIYSFTRLNRALIEVTKGNDNPAKASLLRSFGRLYSKIKYMDADTLKTINLQEFFSELRNDLLRFNNQLGQVFFSY